MSEYCRFAPGHEFHGPYHEFEYGFPSDDDSVLLERLALEINQAGLSWLTVIKKREAFRKAFDAFDVDRVAAYTPADFDRLMADPGIIRNRLKVNAVIENARRIVALRPEYGSFHGWLQRHHPRPLEEWLKLFKKTFVFTGGQIVGEFLMSLGYLPGAHSEDCPVYAKTQAALAVVLPKIDRA